MNLQERKGLRNTALILEELRKLAPEMQMQTALVLLYAALNPEQTMRELGERIGISQAAMSRNVALLGKGLKPGVEGFGLLTAEEDPYERRRKIIKVTTKGERVCRSLAALTNPDLD